MSDENNNPILGSWAERGLDQPAARADVVAVLGEAQGDKPVALGILDQLRTAKAAYEDTRSTMDDQQWSSAEVWRDISGQNADALREGGYEGDIPDLEQPD